MTEYTLDDCTRIFDQGGEVKADHTRPGEIVGIVGPHTRLHLWNAGEFEAPTVLEVVE